MLCAQIHLLNINVIQRRMAYGAHTHTKTKRTDRKHRQWLVWQIDQMNKSGIQTVGAKGKMKTKAPFRASR